MIEIRESKSSDQMDKHQLFINGSLMDKAMVVIKPSLTDESERFMIFVRDYETSERFASHRFSELPPLAFAKLSYKFDWFDFIEEIFVSPSANKQHYQVTFRFGRLSG